MSDAESVLTLNFFIRFFVNLISLLILLRWVHYRSSSHKNSIGGFLLFGNGVFMVTALLHNVEMSMGFAFGLFAVFSMLRYRTEALSITDMAYLFVSITIALMSAVSGLSIPELILINGLMCALAIFCESAFLATKMLEKSIVYENIKLIHPDHTDEMLNDLHQRTGLNIDHVEVGDIDFLRDTAILKVFYLSSHKPFFSRKNSRDIVPLPKNTVDKLS